MEAKLIISGDASKLISEMQKAGNAIRGFETQALSTFAKVQVGIMQMQAKWSALAAVVITLQKVFNSINDKSAKSGKSGADTPAEAGKSDAKTPTVTVKCVCSCGEEDSDEESEEASDEAKKKTSDEAKKKTSDEAKKKTSKKAPKTKEEKEKEGYEENDKKVTNVFKAAQSSVEKAMNGVLNKTQTWSQAMQSIYKSVGAAFINEVVTKPMMKWLEAESRKLLQKMGFLQQENALEATSAAISEGISVEEATTEIACDAAAAGAGAANAMASIPYVGPVLAIAAMGAIYAATMGMQNNLKSAAGGFDIPRGMNPVTQLHEEEMVLPAKISNGLREMIDGGSAGQGLSHVNLTIQAMDGKSVERFFMGNKSLLVDVLKSAWRDGKR